MKKGFIIYLPFPFINKLKNYINIVIVEKLRQENLNNVLIKNTRTSNQCNDVF
jgi:hypothetical protein